MVHLFRRIIIGVVFSTLILTSCFSHPPLPPELKLPKPLQTAGPSIPFRNPNIRADKALELQPLGNMTEVASCLALGQTVYGITLQNTNVRSAPVADACRVGRIPKGTLVQVTELLTATTPSGDTASKGAEQPITSALSPVATLVAPGYREDIQPIFKRTCNACHSAAVKVMGLQVTEYEPLLVGSNKGAVIIPGDAQASLLWQLIDIGKMPMIGSLPQKDKILIRAWIESGAPKERLVQVAARILEPTPTPSPTALPTRASVQTTWLTVAEEDVNPVQDVCQPAATVKERLVSSNLILPISCGLSPSENQLRALLASLAISPPSAAIAQAPQTDATIVQAGAAPSAATTGTVAASPGRSTANTQVGALAPALNVPPITDSAAWLRPQGGFCLDQHAVRNERGITALAFAPDGRLFMALDARLDGQPDPNILYDAFHPSRSIAVYDPVSRNTPQEIFSESSRITGLAYANGALYISRAGEVGRIPDGGKYEPLAGGFAVNSQLFHANNGIVIVGGYIYLSAGGVRDGYSDGPIEGIGEAAAQDIVSGGNRFAARLLRAPLDRLVNEYSINVFETAARGLRNPYGVTSDPAGRIWFTDNGATNVPEDKSAGDEVNLFNPGNAPPGTAEDASPYYGFPLALTGNPPPDWYTKPVVALPNTAAPTSLTWAYGTIFFGQYGHDPGLYRLGRAADGSIIAERIMLIWPLLATATAPDGALWLGSGTGELYRMTPGCG